MYKEQVKRLSTSNPVPPLPMYFQGMETSLSKLKVETRYEYCMYKTESENNFIQLNHSLYLCINFTNLVKNTFRRILQTNEERFRETSTARFKQDLNRLRQFPRINFNLADVVRCPIVIQELLVFPKITILGKATFCKAFASAYIAIRVYFGANLLTFSLTQ